MNRILTHCSLFSLTFISVVNAQYSPWKTFTTVDGLADNRAYAVLADRQGDLWVGTEAGINQYDGINWNDLPDFPDIKTTAIFEDSQDTLWFGTVNGIRQYYHGIWNNFGITSDVRAIIKDHQGALWIGTRGGGVSRRYLGHWDIFDTTKVPLANNYVNAIFQDSQNILWFGTDDGVSSYDGTNWKTFRTPDLGNNTVRAILEDSSGFLWFGTAGGGVSRYDLNTRGWNTFTNTTTAGGLANNDIKDILQDSQGALWFATDGGGVSRYHRNTWRTFDAATTGLAGNIVYSIHEDNQGALWFGTATGVSRYDGVTWTSFTAADSSLASNDVQAIFQDRQDTLWFGTWEDPEFGKNSGGISRYDGKAWTILQTPNGYANNHVNAIFQDSQDTLWFGTRAGLTRYYKGTWKTFTGADGLVGGDAFAIIEYPRGTLWIGTSSGVNLYDGKFINGDTLLTGVRIRAILKDSSDVLWFGTEGRGVYRYDGNSWTNFREDSVLADDIVWSILEDSSGVLWFGTALGVSRYNRQDSTWRNYGTPQLASNDVQAILQDRQGALWFGTALGVSRYYDDTWTTFTTANGLAGNHISAILQDRQDNLWFGGSNLSRFRGDKSLPNTAITAGPASIVGTSTAIFLFRGNDYLTKPEELRFSYALFDNTNKLVRPWVETKMQTASFTDLPNGAYTFKVKAKDKLGTEDSSPATRSFRVDTTPPTINIDSPSNNSFVRGQVEITGSAFDDSPIRDFKAYKVYYASLQQPTRWDSTLISAIQAAEVREDTLAHFDTRGLNGKYQLRLWAIDTLKHISEYVVKVTIDNKPPTCSLLYPAAGAELSGAIPIIGSLADENIREYRLEISKTITDMVWQEIHRDTTSHNIASDTLYVWDSSLVSGEVLLRLTAIDKAGNVKTTAPVLLKLTNVYLLAQISQPRSGSFTTGEIEIVGTADAFKFQNYRLEVRDTAEKTYALTFSSNKVQQARLGIWNTKTFAEGSYKIRLVVKNADGDSSVASTAVVLDKTIPSSAIENIANHAFLKGDTTIIGTAEDKNFAFYELAYKQDDSSRSWLTLAIENTSISSGILAKWNTTKSFDGKYLLRLRVVDKANLDSITVRQVTIDNQQPSVAILLPANNEVVTDTVFIYGNARDANFGYYEVEYVSLFNLTDQGLLHSSSDSVKNGILAKWNTSDRNDTYRINLAVWDRSKIIGRDSIEIIVDNLPPQAVIAKPDSAAVITGIQTIIGKAWDANFKEYRLEYGIGTLPLRWTNIPVDSYTKAVQQSDTLGTWHTTAINADGLYTLRLTVIDQAGLDTSVTRAYTIDNFPVTAKILSPTNDAYITKTVEIKGMATDENFKEYHLEYQHETDPFDRGTITSDGRKTENGLLGTWNTTGRNGRYWIRLSATEKRGYTETAVVLVTIDNLPPRAEITQPIEGATVGNVIPILGTAYDENLDEYFIEWRKATDTLKVWTKTTSQPFQKALRDTVLFHWPAEEKVGEYLLRLTVRDKVGFESRDSVAVRISAALSRADGGTISSSDSLVELFLPPRAIAKNETRVITINPLAEAEQAQYPRQNLRSRVYRIIPDDLKLAKDARITFFEKTYWGNQQEINSVAISLWNESDSAWAGIGATYGAPNKDFSTAIKKFGYFALVSDATVKLDENRNPDEVSIQPRVFSPHNASVNISFTLNKAMPVRIKVFNTSGRLVYTIQESKPMNEGVNVVSWNGRDSNGGYCLSGLYVVVLQMGEKLKTKPVMVMND